MFIIEALVCLALTVYHEARGQPTVGQEAVAHVALNRVASPDFPDTVCNVVMQGGERLHRCQFTWYCDGRSDLPLDERAWADARILAARVLDGTPDPTGGAVYYHTTTVSPHWAGAFRTTVTIGDHVFYVDDRTGL